MDMTNIFLIFVCVIPLLFFTINFLFSPSNPYGEKYSIFECGFHSFLGQNRREFFISFFIYGILFLIFDLEIMILFPYALTQSINGLYGLALVLIFTVILSFGLIFEIGKDALTFTHAQSLATRSK